MVYLVLLILTVVFGTLTVVLAILLAETRDFPLRTAIRKWRISGSYRAAYLAAVVQKKEAEDEARSARQRGDDEAHKAEAIELAAAKRVAKMGSYIIAEQCGDHIQTIRASNYHAKEKKILRSIEVAAQNGYSLSKDEREQLARMFKQAHAAAMRAEAERERQAEIKAQIREEKREEEEARRAVQKAEREERIKRESLEAAIALLGDEHSEQVELLKRELAEAQANSERAISRAQQTRAGHVYVISNVGSFGGDVFKVGLTRRLEPLDRVHELGDASVPFGFDVHAMISCDDAPSLEAALHRDLAPYRMNRVNLRKEFYRVNIEEIIAAVRQHHGEVEYVADAEALELIESRAIEGETGTVESRLEEEAREPQLA